MKVILNPYLSCMKPSSEKHHDSTHNPTADEIADVWTQIGREIQEGRAPADIFGDMNQYGSILQSMESPALRKGFWNQFKETILGSKHPRRRAASVNTVAAHVEMLEGKIMASGTPLATNINVEPTSQQTSTETADIAQQESARLSSSQLAEIESNVRSGFNPQLLPLLDQKQALDQQIQVLSRPVAGGWGSDGTKAPGSIGELYGSVSPHGSYNVFDSVVSPDRTRIITAGSDKTARIVDQQTGGIIKTLNGHTGDVTSVDISSDGRTIVTGSLDKTIKIWDAESGALKKTIMFDNAVEDVECIDGSPMVAVGIKQSSVKVIDTNTGTTVKAFGSSSAPHAFDEMIGQQTVVKNNGLKVEAYNSSTGQLKMTYASPMKSNVSDVDVSADNQRTAAGARYGEVGIWNAQNGQRITSITTGQGDVSEVQWIDNTLLAVGHTTGTVCIFEVNGSNVIEKARYKVPGAVSDIAADPLGTSIIVTTNSGTRGVFAFQAPGIAQKLETAQNQRTSVQQQISYLNTQINRAIVSAQVAAQNTAYEDQITTLNNAITEARPDLTQPVTLEILSQWRSDLNAITLYVQFTMQEIETDPLLQGRSEQTQLRATLGNLNTTIDCAMTEVMTLEEDLLRQQQEEIERAERQESVSRLMVSLQESLESEVAVPYPRMLVTTEYNENAGYTRFSARFRSPADATRFVASVGGKNFDYTYEHVGGTESDIWYFQLMHEENVSGTVTIKMLDAQTGKLLDITIGDYNRGYPGHIATQQLPWDQVEQGRLEEEPIAADLSVVKIEGNNVIVAIESPNDQSYVSFLGGEGLLSQTLVTHEGGTTFSLAMVSFDAALPTGDYVLEMCDRAYGMKQDQVLIHWDKNTRTLTLTNQADSIASTPPENAADIAAFEAMLGIDNAYVDEDNLNYAEGMRMWEATNNLPAPYNFAAVFPSPEQALYDNYPQHRQENWPAEIERRYALDPTWTRGQIEDVLIEERKAELHRIQEANVEYTEAMAKIMQKSVDVYVQLQNGADQRTQLAQLDAVIQENWPSTGTIHGTNIGRPSRQQILDAGKLIFQNSWRQMMQADEAYEDWATAVEREREAKSLEGARLEWERRGGANAVPVPHEMSRREISLGLKIMDTLQRSTDTRIAGWTPRAQQEFAFAVALRAGPNYASDPALLNNALASAGQSDSFWIGTITSTENKDLDYTLGTIVGTRTESKEVTINPEKSAFVTFTIKEEKMVNLWVDPEQSLSSPVVYDVSLRLTGPYIPNTGYPSNKETNASAGESISLRLLPGTYTLEVKDETLYPPEGAAPGYTPSAKFVDVGINIKSYQSQRIEGQISIEGRDVTMPVRMSVAEFDEETGRRKDVKDVKELDPTKPIWIIVHGRTDSESSGKMEALTKALYEYAQHSGNGAQIVTIDWSDAAKNFSSLVPNEFDLSDSDWTKAAGQWGANQLLALSPQFNPEVVSGFVHSHGNGVGYYMAKELKEKTGNDINLFVGLDPAKNPGLAAGSPEFNSVNLKEFSRYSVALDSSWLGSGKFSATADRAFVLQPETNDIDKEGGIFSDEIMQHGAALETMVSIIEASMESNSNFLGTDFNLAQLLNGGQTLSLREDILAGDEQPLGGTPYEGELIIRTSIKEGTNSSDRWLGATPISFQYMTAGEASTAIRKSISGLFMQDIENKSLQRFESAQSWVGDVNQQNTYTFNVDQARSGMLSFTLPKPDTQLHVMIKQTHSNNPDDLNFLPYYATIDAEHLDLFLSLNSGSYQIIISQVSPSQGGLVLGTATNADVPYTITLK